MPTDLLIRLAAVALTVLAVRLLPDPASWLTFVYIMTLSHVTRAALYSRRQTSRVLSAPRGVWALSLLALGAVFLYRRGFSLVFYFGMHHVFNEVYVWDRDPAPEKAAVLKPLRRSAFWLHSFAYVWLLRGEALFASLAPRLLAAGLLVSAFGYFLALDGAGGALTGSERLDRGAFELGGLLLCAASLFIRFNLLDVVVYHVLFWELYPIPGQYSRGGAAAAKYLAGAFAAALFGLLLSPAGIFSYPLQGSLFERLFYFGTYLHITLSLALSTANPRWLRRAFQPALA